MIKKSEMTDSLKPQVTKRTFEEGSSECSECNRDKNISYWISEVKQYEATVANEKSHHRKGKYQIDEITFTKGGLLLMVKSRKLSTLKSNL